MLVFGTVLLAVQIVKQMFCNINRQHVSKWGLAAVQTILLLGMPHLRKYLRIKLPRLFCHFLHTPYLQCQVTQFYGILRDIKYKEI